MGVRGALWLLLVTTAAVSCGGRYLEQGSDPSSGSSNGAGVQAETGGTPNDATGGRRSDASGAPAKAGQGQAAGTTTMGGASCGECPLIGCSDGYVAVPPAPGECCSTSCRLDCPDVGCSAIDLDCRAGFHVGALPDECCPRCLPDEPVSCMEAMIQYGMLRTELMKKYQALGCADPGAGCFLFQELNRCAVHCGTPIPRQARDFIEEELHNFAWDYCTDCPLPEEPNCPEPGAFSCQADNTCQFDAIGAK